MSVTIALSRVHFPVTSLGFGRRVGIWMQGCSIQCRGCIVPETWVSLRDHLVPLGALFSAIEPWLREADGVTISGGEPFDQPVALEALLRGLRRQNDGDILLYSGYPESRLRERHARILELVDGAIVEPFRLDSPDERPFVGSTNQRFLAFTPIGQERNARAEGAGRRRDISVTDEEVLMAGVPRSGELDDLIETLNATGRSARSTQDAGR